MENYLGSLAAGAANVFSWPGILIPVAGTAIAMVTSFLPGIGTSSLAAILIIATLTWDPVSVLLLFGALTGGATFMGSITAILFNIPGGAQSAATLIDGYPLGQKGLPKTAIACAATASAVGSIIGVVVLIALLPFVRSFLLEFGPLERVLLGVWGLTTLIALPNISPSKAVVMAFLGFLFAMIGTDPYNGLPRWTFGAMQLGDGMSKIAVLIGLFTFAELIGWTKNIALDPSTLARTSAQDSVWRGVVSVFVHKWLVLRSSILGTIVGIVPGIGGTVASFVAYGQAVQSAKGDKSQFGKGDIRGLIAPEAAHDAKDGGSLLPALAFGLPGSEGGVILIAIMALHGLVPGTPMLTTQLPLTFTLIFALLFSNILTSIVGLSLTPYLARLSRIRIDRLALPALVISLVAIVQLEGRMSDLYTVVGFGLAGYYFKLHDWPRVPFVVAFILAEFMETNMTILVQLVEYDRVIPHERPAALILVLLLTLVVIWALRKPRLLRGGVGFTSADIMMSGMIAVIGAGFFFAALTGGKAMSLFAKLVPLGTAVSALICLGLGVLAIRRAGGMPEWRAALRLPAAHRLGVAMLALVAPVALLVGFVPALGLMVFIWIAQRGHWHRRAIVQAGVTGLLVSAGTYYTLTVMSHRMMDAPLISVLF